MLLSLSLTGCSQQTKEENASDIQAEASADALTLSLYLMSELPVDPETEARIEMEVNKLTKAKFSTQIDLRYFTEADYYGVIDKAFADREAAKANGTLSVGQETAGVETNEDGKISVEKIYPEIADYQVDIFYFSGKANYDRYMAAGQLQNLNNELSDAGGSNALNKYISPQFLSALQGMGGKYAIPTNKAIGEYTYLLLDKQALNAAKRRVDGTPMDPAPYTSLTCADTADFLTFVKTYLGEQYAPLYTNLSETDLLVSNLKYWGLDESGKLSDSFSVIGNYVNGNASFLNAEAYGDTMQNLFENDRFTADLQTLNTYKTGGYYRAAEDTKPFAVGYVKGGAELVDQYSEQYEMIVLERPMLTAEDVFTDMFGVSYCTTDLARSMEIVTYLNTSKEFRNIILYGVEDVHYEVKDYEVTTLNEQGEEVTELYAAAKRLQVGTQYEYKMSVHKTGNELIAYPEVIEGQTLVPNINEYAIKQNRDAITDLYCGFTADYQGFAVNTAEMATVRELSAKLLNEYLACDSAEAFKTYLAAAKAEVAGNAAVKNQIDPANTTSLAACFAAWKTAMKIK
jgi:hypothetical protein